MEYWELGIVAVIIVAVIILYIYFPTDKEEQTQNIKKIVEEKGLEAAREEVDDDVALFEQLQETSN